MVILFVFLCYGKENRSGSGYFRRVKFFSEFSVFILLVRIGGMVIFVYRKLKR